MRTVVIKLASGKEKAIDYPTTYFDVKTKTFIKLVEGWNLNKFEVTPESLIKVFGVATDHDWMDYALTTDNRIESAMLKCVRFILEQVEDLNFLPIPKYFAIDGKTFELPKNLGKLTLGQNLHIRMVIEDKDIRSKIAFATAVYMQPIIDGMPFNTDRVKYYEQLMLEMPVTDIYPVGFFFLRPLENFGKEPMLSWRQILSMLLRRLESVVSFTKTQKSSYLIPTGKSY